MGMLYTDVVNLIGLPNEDIGSGAIIHKYVSSNSDVLLLYYCKNAYGQLVLYEMIIQ